MMIRPDFQARKRKILFLNFMAVPLAIELVITSLGSIFLFMSKQAANTMIFLSVIIGMGTFFVGLFMGGHESC